MADMTQAVLGANYGANGNTYSLNIVLFGNWDSGSVFLIVI